MYITQKSTDTTCDESMPVIAPLVLPTQLDSEESDSECEEGTKGDTTQCFNKGTAEYDDNEDKFVTQLTSENINVKIDKASCMVSKFLRAKDFCHFYFTDINKTPRW